MVCFLNQFDISGLIFTPIMCNLYKYKLHVTDKQTWGSKVEKNKSNKILKSEHFARHIRYEKFESPKMKATWGTDKPRILSDVLGVSREKNWYTRFISE